MNKKQQTLLTLAALALPLSAFAVDMPGGLPAKQAPMGMGLPAEATISILPAASLALPFQMEPGAAKPPKAAVPTLIPADITIAPAAPLALPFQMEPAAGKPQTAAKADVQAMLDPEQPIAPKAAEIANMSGDQAAGAGQAMMDRILYEVSAGKASEPASPGAGSASPSSVTLAPARRGIGERIMAGPIKFAQASTHFVSKTTGLGPRWSAGLLALPHMVAGTYMMADAALGQTVPLWLGIAGFLFFGVMMVGAYGRVLDTFQRQADARKLENAAAKAQAQFKDVPGVVAVKSGHVKVDNVDHDVIVVQVSRLDSSNIARIPKTAEGYSVRVEFVR